MFDPDAHRPRINREMAYLGACLIAGIRLARERQVNVPVIPPKSQSPRLVLKLLTVRESLCSSSKAFRKCTNDRSAIPRSIFASFRVESESADC